jgi:superfamily I DNA and/or RNA helicase
MLTRAKSVEVVIGDPDTLKKDPFWKAFVEYCENNQSFVNKDISKDIPNDKVLKCFESLKV